MTNTSDKKLVEQIIKSNSTNDNDIATVFQHLWSKAVDNPDYEKAEWNWLFNQLQLRQKPKSFKLSNNLKSFKLYI